MSPLPVNILLINQPSPVKRSAQNIENSISIFVKRNHMNYIDYNKMELNIMESDQENLIIASKAQYENALKNNKGIYRYTNFDQQDVHYNENIKNQVLHYRSLFLDILQNELNKIIENAQECVS